MSRKLKINNLLQNLSKLNKDTYFEDMKNILYFDDYEYKNTDFLFNNENAASKLSNLNKMKQYFFVSKNTYRKLKKKSFSYRIQSIFKNRDIIIENIGYNDFVNIIVNKHFKNNITYHDFYRQLYHTYIQSNLFKLFEYNKHGFDATQIKYNLKSKVLTFSIIQLICDYLKINIIIFDDINMNIFCCDKHLYTFRNIIFLYYNKRTKLYHLLENLINYNNINNQNNLFVFNVVQYYVKSTIPLGHDEFKCRNMLKKKKLYYKCMKISKLKNICELYNLDVYDGTHCKKKNELIQLIINMYVRMSFKAIR